MHEFSDAAVSGTKRDRVGVNKMLKATKQREFGVLYLYSLSRLARESLITLPLIKRLMHTFGIRVGSVTKNLDTVRGDWEMMTMIFATISERYLKDLSLGVFRSQEETVLSSFSVGDYCFGYGSEPIPSSEQTRRGRNAKSRMKYVVNDDTMIWVVRVFHWFAVENRSIEWIDQ